MATYYEVKSDPADALIRAAQKATQEERSQTVYFAVNAPGIFLVGPTSKAEDMRQAGAAALYSVQAHAPPCLRMDSMECWEEEDHAP